ncbi:MAG TPA: hypothetical protein VIH49_06230 [Solirubrobacteraceae bacterium]
MQRGIAALASALTLLAVLVATASAERGFLPRKTSDFTTISGKVAFETTGKTKVLCATSEGKGELTSDKHGTATLSFGKCAAVGFSFNSLADPKETILIAKALVLVCLINPEKLIFGLYIELPTAGVHVEEPAAGVLLLWSGSVIAELLGSKATSFGLDLATVEGHQAITQCSEEKGGEVKKAQFVQESNESKKVEALTLTEESATLKFLEVMELMDA